jgi:lysophospholipase L1-like esterase
MRSNTAKWAAAICGFAVLQAVLYATYGKIKLFRDATKPFEIQSALGGSPRSARPPLVLGFIGDSNTVRGKPSPPITCATLLSKAVLRPVSVVNCGRGGMTAEQWRPDHRVPFDLAVRAFKEGNVQVVCVMLGTNPGSVKEASPERYEANIRAICQALKRNGWRVVLHYPPYKVESGGKSYTQDYQSVINRLVKEQAAEPGDTRACEYFSLHPEETVEGIHLTQQGSESLGTMWAFALNDRLRTLPR